MNLILSPDRLRRNGACPTCGAAHSAAADEWALVDAAGRKFCLECIQQMPNGAELLATLVEFNAIAPGQIDFGIAINGADLLANSKTCSRSSTGECFSPLVIREYTLITLCWRGSGSPRSWCWRCAEARLPAPLIDLLCRLNCTDREPLPPAPSLPPPPTPEELRAARREERIKRITPLLSGMQARIAAERLHDILSQMITDSQQEYIGA